jgi:hypothetical protein
VQLTLSLEKDILKLQVTVNDSPDMAIMHGIHDLSDDSSRFDFTNASSLLNPLVQFSSSSTLHDHDKLFALYEGMIELNNVLVLELLQGFGLLVDILTHGC